MIDKNQATDSEKSIDKRLASPISQFRDLLLKQKDQKASLHETLKLLNEGSNYDSHLTIGGGLVGTRSTDKIIWATVELDSDKDKENEKKSDRMCPVAMHTEQWESVWQFNEIAFRKPDQSTTDQKDPWKEFIDQKKMLPLSIVIDRCLNINKKEGIKPILAEYFIVVLPECLSTKVDLLIKYGKLYQNGRAAILLPKKQNGNQKLTYFLCYKDIEKNNDNEKNVDELCYEYDNECENYSFMNFVNWIRDDYNRSEELEIKEKVGIYVGYCFSDYKDARLWAAFSTQADESDIQAVESLLYKVHQEQTIRLMRDTIKKIQIERLWSDERKNWFSEQSGDELMPHSLKEHDEANYQKTQDTVQELLQEYLDNKVPKNWLERLQFQRIYETLKGICGCKSITQGNSSHNIGLNSLFLIAAFALGQKIDKNQFDEKVTKTENSNYREFLSDESYVTSKISNIDGREALKAFFILIESLSFSDDGGQFILTKIDFSKNFLKFYFDLPYNKPKNGSGRSLKDTILTGNGGVVTKNFLDFKNRIQKITSGDLVYIESRCIVNFRPLSDTKPEITVLEIIPIKS